MLVTVARLHALLSGDAVLHGRGDSRCTFLGMGCHRPAEEIVDGHLKESDPTTERLGRQWRMSRERPMDDEWCALERRRAKEHRLPEIVHPRQMGSPVHMSDIVEDGSEQVIISHSVVEDIHEARYITTISDIEPLLLHIRLLSVPGTAPSSVGRTDNVVAVEQGTA